MSRQQPELPEPVLTALWTVLDHLYLDERAHYLGSPPELRPGHLFESLLLIHAWLHATEQPRPSSD